MRFLSLFFMVSSLLLLPREGRSQYDTDILSVAHESPLQCSDLAPDCKNSSMPRTYQNFYKLASETCKSEQESLKCSELTEDPELKGKIRNCSAQALCDESMNSIGNSLRGCFWNAPGAWGTAAWSAVKSGAENTIKSIPEKLKFSHPLQILFRDLPVLTPEKISKTKDLPFYIYDEAAKWLTDKKVRLQCYDRRSQAELICYGALNVFAPGAALKAGQQVPKIVNLLKLAPGLKAEKAVAEVVDQSKRSPEVNLRKTPDSPRIISRQNFIDQNINLSFASIEQNEKWIKLAENIKPDGKTKYFEVENSVMKLLNDTTQDKNFVTALTNKNKYLLKDKIDVFAKAHPEIEVLPYADFKSMRFAIRPKPPATELPKSVQTELDSLFRSANAEFTDFMKTQNFVRSDDRPEEWFRAGFGETADQATLASRYSRNISGENKLRSFSDHDFHDNLQTSLKATEMYRRDLQKDLAESGVMELIPGSKKMTFKKEVFEAVRKTSTTDELKATFEKSFGTKITDIQATRIRDYSELVDEFSPGIHVAKREVASLTESTHGGLSIDFSGLGADNLRATAISLSKSTKIDEAVVATRLGEKSVSQAFLDKKKSVQTSVQSVLEKNGIQAEILTSGDDMVIKPSKPIPEKVRTEIAKSLAENVNPSAVRVAHVPTGIAAEADRMIIGTHGETLEKLTRKNLQGEIPREKLSQVLLMVDMQSTTAGNGAAKLILESTKTRLNDLEQQKIKKAFEKAIQDMNGSLKQQNVPASYKSAS